MNADDSAPLCSKFQWAFTLLGRPWTGMIVRALLNGPKRSKEILQMIPNISSRVLHQRLGELEGAGIVERTIYEEKPVRIEYGLTEMGRTLEPAMDEVQKWADRWCTEN
ncbi:winged helix-turn-helix transcriptional regulator [Alicyclobacillus dauci]|uniref:Helix-turn-helix transcriptional regulator n=1 Tax=Alicyclobacillus dauci TaxID=1475485 RepID=A0ABY6Z8R4_9BACL|nr:helix-turn-helix domain-containing protein [Alicyclobacillus dauci]WAH39118.1 helix-turn-helix transcriptional regulator [Alicyclobacillus dauci]